MLHFTIETASLNSHVGTNLPDYVTKAIASGIDYALDEYDGPFSDLETENELLEEIENVEALGKLVNRNVDSLISTINDKIYEIDELAERVQSPSLTNHYRPDTPDKFTDDDIRSLFATLLE